MSKFVYSVSMICKRCGSYVSSSEMVAQKDYETWKAINQRRQRYCRHCRHNVKVTFEPR